MIRNIQTLAAGALAALALGGCATTTTIAPAATADAHTVDMGEKFEQDRAAILAMAGDYKVTFDFEETVAFVDGYELPEPYITGGYESVRVIEDRGDFISMQHVLVVGGKDKFPVKHWRQDWHYEPESVLIFVGGNAWEHRAVSEVKRKGKWSQIVYQVDDAPRYGALAAWSHDGGVSEWTPPAEWRPLPRRDATKRDDYHAIDAVNRHAITPFGWVHEQDNSKLVLTGGQQLLVREIGVNTYTRDDSYEIAVAEDYWAATERFWAGVRQKWSEMEASGRPFGLTIQGEPEELYMQILPLADAVAAGEKSNAEAIAEARAVINEYTTMEIGSLADRLAPQSLATRY
ncbi:MAG: DUF6607 family protein [Pseudomonadota bacterium]